MKGSGLPFMLLLAGACMRTEPSVAPVRLVDLFPQATVEGTPPAEGVSYPPTE